MVDAIVSCAVNKISEFLIQEVAFLQGVREEAKWLRTELQFMRAFLKYAEAKQGGDPRVREWVSEITEVSYETVDILDEYYIKTEEKGASRRGRINEYVRSCACICYKQVELHHIGNDIESLKKRILDISRKRETYGIKNIDALGEGTSNDPNSTSLALRRATSPYADDEEQPIGLEDVTNALLAELLKTEPSRSVVSIHGMGGLGKTSLARKLYNKVNFPCKVWVCVAQGYSTQYLLHSIIKCLKTEFSKDEMKLLEKMDERELVQYVRKLLDERRYLAVLDDVWHREDWDCLKKAFPDFKNGSRIILTTRNKSIAMRADDKNFVHELRFLTEEESWDLFLKKAFPRGNRFPPAKEVLAREMVGKCRGLPLAIIVLGGLLSRKDELEEWVTVKEHIWKQLKKDEPIEISELLSLSYDDLLPELKQCFLYMGMFPEDYEIVVPKLIRLWVAEEFITEGEETMENVAEEFFNELINRSLVQVAGRFWEKVVKCRIHDLLRDLAIEKAREVKCFHIFDPHNNSSASFTHRRHAIYNQDHVPKYVSARPSNSRLRTLVLCDELPSPVDYSVVKQLVSRCLKFKLLRVLDLECIKCLYTEQNFEILGRLIHLKYLGLYLYGRIKIPPCIGNLRCLQSFIIKNYGTVGLPREICELKQLRHLQGYFEGPLCIDTLTNLQTLRVVRSHQLSKIDPINLRNLRELSLEDASSLEFVASSLEFVANLTKLGTFILTSSNHAHPLPSLKPLSSCNRLQKLWLSGPMKKMPELNEFPPSLTRLILSYSKLSDDPMPTLEKLPNLRSLELLEAAYLGEKMVCSANGFQQLEFLRIIALSQLEEWIMEEGAMPMIRGLRIYECDRLQMIPEVLKSVPEVGKARNSYTWPRYRDM